MEASTGGGTPPENGIEAKELARTGARLLLLALVLGVATGAATWAFLTVDHLGVHFLWEVLPEQLPTVPASLVAVAVVIAMTALASAIVLLYKRRPFDTGVAEHEYDEEGRMEYRHIPAGVAFSLASLWSGAAIGPEAPLVDINGGIGTLMAERIGLERRHVKVLTYAGVAGALAAFLGGAPVGALIAMEFISPKSVSMSKTELAGGLAAGASAWATYVLLGGHELGMLFPFPDYAGLSYYDLILALVLGAAGGAIGLAYGGFFVKARVRLQSLRSKPLLAGVAGGTATAVAAVASPYLLFSGQAQVPIVIEKAATIGVFVLVLLGLGKVLLSVWGLSTAYFGGPLFPLMFTALCFGLALNLAVPAIPQAVAVMALMVGVLVAATVAPLSMTIFLALITNSELISVIAVAAVAAYIVRQGVAPTLPGVYRQTAAAEGRTEAAD